MMVLTVMMNDSDDDDDDEHRLAVADCDVSKLGLALAIYSPCAALNRNGNIVFSIDASIMCESVAILGT